MPSSNIQKSTTGLTFSTTLLLLTLFCSEAAVMEMMHDKFLSFTWYILNQIWLIL